jgi:hypothetical protein
LTHLALLLLLSSCDLLPTLRPLLFSAWLIIGWQEHAGSHNIKAG